jgi:MFS family permease
MLLIILARNQMQIVLLALPAAMGVGTFLVTNWAWATDLVPRGEAAKYLGLTNLATAGGAVVARLGGPLIDLLNFQQPGLGYAALPVAIALMLLVGTVLLLKVPETRHPSSLRLLPSGRR